MRLLKTPLFRWNEIVIGGNTNAFFYASKKGCHIIPNIMDIPLAHNGPSFANDLGVNLNSSEDEWRFMAYKLNRRGLNPFTNKIKHIRIDEPNKQLVVNIGTPNIFYISYDELRVFDTENVSGLSFESQERVLGYQVYDWFDVRSGMKHGLDFIEDPNSNFVKKIHFFLSERIDGNYDKKDLVAESFLSEEQIHDIDYSDSISRLKTINMMKGAGIKGKKNGLGSHASIKLELWKREIKKLKSIKSFQKGDIIIDGRPLEEIKNEFSSSRDCASRRPPS